MLASSRTLGLAGYITPKCGKCLLQILGLWRGTTPHRLSPEFPSKEAKSHSKLMLGSPGGELSPQVTEGWFLKQSLMNYGT